LQKFSFAKCSIDADCVRAIESSNCAALCPDAVVPATEEAAFENNLRSAGNTCNAVCPPLPPVFCPAVAALCINGTCSAGSPIGAGGSTGTSGAAGASGVAGASGSGGSTGSGCGPCPPTSCNPGFVSVVDPTISCCPICRPLDCSAVTCPLIDCPPGTHAETPTNQCCPACVTGFSKACNDAMTTYNGQRMIMLDKYGSAGCNIDSDCMFFTEHNACVTNCGEALPVSTYGSWDQNIQGLADSCNAVCPPKPLPSCAHFVAVCSNGKCVAAPGPAI
jgi:hypothetical protein